MFETSRIRRPKLNFTDQCIPKLRLKAGLICTDLSLPTTIAAAGLTTSESTSNSSQITGIRGASVCASGC